MKKHLETNKSHMRTKVIGIILIILGIIFLYDPSPLNIKLSFTSILIGIIWIFLITEKNIPKNISETQNQGAFDAIEKLIHEHNLLGNAIFLPKSKTLSEERIYIPQSKTDDKSPIIDSKSVLIRKKNMVVIGLSLPPSGLKLLTEIEKEIQFHDIGIENVEDNLKKFIGLNLVKSITLTKYKNTLKLIIKSPLIYKENHNLSKQYPGTICSAAITAITHATKKAVRITNTKIDKDKITFNLKIKD